MRALLPEMSPDGNFVRKPRATFLTAISNPIFRQRKFDALFDRRLDLLKDLRRFLFSVWVRHLADNVIDNIFDRDVDVHKRFLRIFVECDLKVTLLSIADKFRGGGGYTNVSSNRLTRLAHLVKSKPVKTWLRAILKICRVLKTQRIQTYFVRGKYQCMADLLFLFGFSCFAYVLLVRSNRRSAVQWYFPYGECSLAQLYILTGDCKWRIS